MRIIAATLIIMALPLAACGKGSSFDEGFKKSFREKFVQNCSTAAAGAAPAGTITIDFPRICGCTADRLMKDRSATQLVNIPEADQQTALKACVAEIYPQGVPQGNKAASSVAPG